MDKSVEKSIKFLDSKKAENIVCLDLRKVTTLTDYFIIVTANSETHARALTNDLVYNLKKDKKLIPRNSGDTLDNKWIILDYYDFVIHIFIKEMREHYDLESLWFEAKKVTIS